MRLLAVTWLVFSAAGATSGQQASAPQEAEAPEAPPEQSAGGDGGTADRALVKPGPRKGRFGVRTILLGTSLTPGANLVPAFGLRLFAQDKLSLNARVGLGLTSEQGTTRVGYQLGFGASLYTRSGDLPGVYPFLEGEAALGRSETREQVNTVLSLTVGLGLEAWLSPYVSTGALLRVGIAKDFVSEALAVGTINPGLVVTLYLN